MSLKKPFPVLKILTLLLMITYVSCGQKKMGTDLTDNSENQETNRKGWQIASTNDWLIGAGLNNVESIIYDKENDVFYATNGTDYSPGVSGFISKIAADGSLQELKWVDSLSRPTGMAMDDSLLYVADVNSLVSINLSSGQIVSRYLEPIPNSGLNDVTITDDGSVYVTASFVHSVFRLQDGKLEMWSKNIEKLKWANGITSSGSQLLVAGQHLTSICSSSKKVRLISLNSQIEDFDGIVNDAVGGYFVTTVENSGLFHIDDLQNVTVLSQADAYFGDLEFIPDRNEIFVPRGDKKTNEFFISVFKLK